MIGIILVKKNAFNNWSYNHFQSLAGVSSIQSCFSQVSVLVNPYRAGILISVTHLYILCFGLSLVYLSYAVKRIQSGPIRIFQIRALISS